MSQPARAEQIETGYHPDGYRIDKTASPMNRYTRWRVSADGNWSDPQPVCFDSLPPEGWIEADGFDWEDEGKAPE